MDSQIWINTLPKKILNSDEGKYRIDPKIWTNTIPQTKPKNSIKKYPIVMILFVVGLVFVSAIKNETRNLQKEIYNLQASLNILKSDLYQETLDHEVITSPENISRLAKENLNFDLNFYKKSQIKNLSEKKIDANKLEKKNFASLPEKIKVQVVKKIEKKKSELKKLKELYSKPEELPSEIKTHVAKKIKKTQFDIKKLYNSPKEVITPERIKRWTGIQLVKLFLGIPVMPGR